MFPDSVGFKIPKDWFRLFSGFIKRLRDSFQEKDAPYFKPVLPKFQVTEYFRSAIEMKSKRGKLKNCVRGSVGPVRDFLADHKYVAKTIRESFMGK